MNTESRDHTRKHYLTTAGRLVLLLALLAGLLAAGGAREVMAQGNPVPVQTFYVPFPEDQLLLGLRGITGTTVPTNPITTYISLAAIADGTIIYYDHWEYGYDDDIANPDDLYSYPGNVDGTQIWGNGEADDGCPPNFSGVILTCTDANDVINAGAVIVLRNNVSTTSPLTIDFDGRDKIATTKNIAVTRTGWANGSGTLLAGSVEVFDTSLWGTSYRVPVGENIPDTTDYQMFSYTGLAIMAGPAGATVQIDADNDGGFETTVTLTEGQSHFVNGGVNVGAQVVSDNPVQVDILTGDRGSNYESRDSALLPTDLWSSSYYTPVSTANPTGYTAGTTVWLYNPNATAITVSYEWSGGSDSISVGAGSYSKVILDDPYAYHFYTAGDQHFYAFSTTDSTSSSSGDNQAWDWGYSLVPEESLTPQVLIGLGIGKDPTYTSTENGNPVWVTPVGNGATPVTVYVDYDGDGVCVGLTDPNGNCYDVSYNLTELQQLKIFDPDRDQTGMLVYVLTPGVKLAAAWGQDPLAASASNPGLDVGTGVPPFPLLSPGKNGTLYTDNDGDGFVSAGDVLEYTIIVNNISRAPVPDVVLIDYLPDEVSYVEGSTEVDGVSIADDVDPATPFPFDETGRELGSLPVGDSFTVTLLVLIDNPLPLGTTDILNQGKAISVGIEVPFEDLTPLGGKLDVQKYVSVDGGITWVDADEAPGPYASGGTNPLFKIVVTNTGNANLSNVDVTDDVYGDIHLDGTLAIGEYAEYTITTATWAAGQHTNTATATGDFVDEDGVTQTLTDTDPANYFGQTPSISIVKTTNEDDGLNIPVGDPITWTYVVTNTGNVALTSVTVTDDQGVTVTCPQTTLAVDESMTCTATGVAVAGAYSNIGTATGTPPAGDPVSDSDPSSYFGSDPEITVTKTGDPTSVPETGGDVTFTYVVANTGNVPVTITSLADDQFGTLAGDADCMVGTELAAGTSCSFEATFAIPAGATGSTHVDVFTAHADDADGNDASDTDDETITRTDVEPEITVTKTGDPLTVPETGGDVTFTYVVENTGDVAVTITSLADDQFGTLAGDADCMVGTELAAGTSCSFEATFFVKGDYETSTTHTNTFIAHAEDAEENDAWDDDDETVTFTDVDPAIDVEKYVSIDGGLTWADADTATGPYLVSGTAPQFMFVVTNTGNVALSNVDVTDDVLGNIHLDGTLAVGASAEYFVTGTWAAGQHTNTATASGEMTDGAGNTETATDTDDANYFGADPSFTVSKACDSTQPVSQEGPASFEVTFTNNGNVPLNITSDDGIGTFDLAIGEIKSFSVSLEGPFSGYATADNTVNASATYTDDAGTVKTVTHEASASCRVGSRINVLKLVNGEPNPEKEFTFSLWVGPKGFNGTKLASDTSSGKSDGFLTFGNPNLDRFKTYTLCEEGVPVSWMTEWLVGGVPLTPYNPDYDPNIFPNEDYGNRCVDFGAGTIADLLTDGDTLVFQVNNSTEYGEGRTPGYWKNWSSCSGGKQFETAAKNGGWEADFWTLDDVLGLSTSTFPYGGIVWDDILADGFEFPIDSCELGVSILSSTDIGNRSNKSNDAAYTLARQLLATQANFIAGVNTCPAVVDAAEAAEQLLDKLNFDASGDFLSNKNKKVKADYNLALSLATTLDQYNNNVLCSYDDTPSNYPPVVVITGPADGATVSGTSVAITADASDDSGVTQVEFFVDGVSIGLGTESSDIWSASWDLTGVSDGAHSITATATDTTDQTSSHAISITVDNVTEPPIKVVSLEGDSAWTKAGVQWRATVTVTVDPALEGAVVTGKWSNGASGTCTTDAYGVCTITLSNISKKTASVTFTVSNVVKTGYVYEANGDPTVTVYRP